MSTSERLDAALSDRYRVERKLGEGGMATVWLAEDTRHDRRVAIKVLRPELAAVVGAERFLTEIRTTANLEDPHILPLYDSGEAEGFLFYVMPYVEGDTLRERLEREGQLPVDEALDIGRKVASALQYAHDQGVVHRDVKPANILLRRGEPLVADFGIALALTQAGGGRITETGLSLGTPHYMSPEQAAGERTLDPRSDVYALGCVIHEMLAGEPPHPGPNAQAVLARILTDTPRRVTELRRTVPAHVDAAVAKALEKLPADRFGSARELAAALDDPDFRHEPSGPARSVAPVSEARRSSRRIWVAAALVLGVVIAALGVWGLGRGLSSPAQPVLRFSVAIPDEQRMVTPQYGSPVAMSPDGTHLVYAGVSPDAPWQLWLRPTSSLEATPLPGSEASFTPIFSPDGSRVAFVDPESRIQVVELGRSSERVVTGRAVALVDWSPGGWIYYQSGQTFGDIRRVRPDGGEPEMIPVVSGESGPTPEWGEGDVLPGDDAMVVTRYAQGAGRSLSAAEIVLVDFEDASVTSLAQGSDPTFVPPDRILWADPAGDLVTARLDRRSRSLDGPGVPAAEGVLTDVNGTMHYAVSESGSLVYRAGSVAGDVGGLVWVERDGSESSASDVEMGLTVGLWDAVDVSPDGSRVALSVAEGPASHLWVVDLEGDAPPRRISFQGTLNVRPRWTPDGDSLTYVTNAAGARLPTQLWIRAADGTGEARPLVVHDREVEEGLISPDSRWIVYRLGGTATNRDIYARQRGEGSEERPLFATGASERAMDLSPDGRWIAYVSDETGRDQVFVTPFPDVRAGRWQVSSGGGVSPRWSHDGSELFFVGQGGNIVAVRYTATGSSFEVAAATPLFSADGYLVGVNHTGYAVAPDDRRFLMISIGGEGRELVWVQNWTAELQR